mgnify:CR=1 FL=1
MIDIDNPPLVLLGIIVVVFVAPYIYSFFVDNYDKDKPQIKT